MRFADLSETICNTYNYKLHKLNMNISWTSVWIQNMWLKQIQHEKYDLWNSKHLKSTLSWKQDILFADIDKVIKQSVISGKGQQSWITVTSNLIFSSLKIRRLMRFLLFIFFLRPHFFFFQSKKGIINNYQRVNKPLFSSQPFIYSI